MDLKKIFTVIKIPLLVLILLNAITTILSLVLFIPLLLLVTWLDFLAPYVISIYVGADIQKKLKTGLIDSGIGAGITLLIGSVVNLFILFLLIYSGVLNLIMSFSSTDSAGNSFIVPGIRLEGTLIFVISQFILGFILGAIGGFIAQKTVK